MDLLLVRHGLAGKADAAKWPDDDSRPLTDKGSKAFKRAAKGLRAQGLQPGKILSSPALRTRETAAILAKALGLGSGAIADFRPAHYTCKPAAAMKALAGMRLPGEAALVGHEPWLGEFLGLAIAAGPSAGMAFVKGGAALVRFPGDPAAGKGVLVWLMTQDQLADLA
jgi:phosphohistidine phosphatase